MTFVGNDPIATRAQMDAVLQAVSATVWVLDRDLRFEASRGVVPRRQGLAHDELVGLHLDDYLGDEAPERDRSRARSTVRDPSSRPSTPTAASSRTSWGRCGWTATRP